MSNLTDQYFATIRETLQKPHTLANWETILAQVRHATGDARERRRFVDEYLPYIEQSLDDWPDEVRRVGRSEHNNEVVMGLARVLVLDFHYREPTKKAFNAQMKAWGDGRLSRCKGLVIHHANKYADFMVRELLGVMHPDLERFEFTFHYYGWNEPKRGELSVEAFQEFLESVFEEHAETLRAIGVDTEYNDEREATEAHWDALCTWAPKMSNLRELIVGHAQGTSRDWFVHAMRDEAFDALDTLSISSVYYHPPLSAITEREASLHLRRLRLSDISESQAMELIHAENLRHVEVWELAPDRHYRYQGWGTQHAQHWATVIARQRAAERGEEAPKHPLLSEYDLNVRTLGRDELDSIFLTERGELVPSDFIQAIAFGGVSRRLFDALLAHGHEAYPNLRVLMFGGDTEILLSDYPALEESKLFERLGHVDWSTRYWDDWSQEQQGRRDAELWERHARAWLSVVEDEEYSLYLRRLAWRTFVHASPMTIPFHKRRAKLLGLKGYSRLKADDYADFLDQAVPEEIRMSTRIPGLNSAPVPSALYR